MPELTEQEIAAQREENERRQHEEDMRRAGNKPAQAAAPLIRPVTEVDKENRAQRDSLPLTGAEQERLSNIGPTVDEQIAISKRGVAKTSMPMRFVFLRGAPGAITLRPSRKALDPKDGSRYTVGPIMVRSEPLQGAKNGERYIDVEQLECVRRPDFPATPAEVSALLQKTTYFANPDAPSILTWDEYQDNVKQMGDLEAQQLELKKKIQQGLRAKRGSRTPVASTTVSGAIGSPSV